MKRPMVVVWECKDCGLLITASRYSGKLMKGDNVECPECGESGSKWGRTLMPDGCLAVSSTSEEEL